MFLKRRLGFVVALASAACDDASEENARRFRGEGWPMFCSPEEPAREGASADFIATLLTVEPAEHVCSQYPGFRLTFERSPGEFLVLGVDFGIPVHWASHRETQLNLYLDVVNAAFSQRQEVLIRTLAGDLVVASVGRHKAFLAEYDEFTIDSDGPKLGSFDGDCGTADYHALVVKTPDGEIEIEPGASRVVLSGNRQFNVRCHGNARFDDNGMCTDTVSASVGFTATPR